MVGLVKCVKMRVVAKFEHVIVDSVDVSQWLILHVHQIVFFLGHKHLTYTYLPNKDFCFLDISLYYPLCVRKHTDHGASMAPSASQPPYSDAGNHIGDIPNCVCKVECEILSCVTNQGLLLWGFTLIKPIVNHVRNVETFSLMMLSG